MMLRFLKVFRLYNLWVIVFSLVYIQSNIILGKSNNDLIIAGRGVKDTAGYYYWKEFTDNIEKSLPSQFNIKTFMNAELGPEETILRNLRRNKVQISGISVSGLSLIIPELSLLRLPYLFNNEKEISYILESEVEDLVSSLLREKGLVMLDWMYGGWVNFYTTFPLTEPKDLIGKRIRVSVDDISIKLMKSLGADFTQIPFTDIIPALQSGLIDGGEQSTQLYISGGIYDAASYYTVSKHAYVFAVIVANLEWFEKLEILQKDVFYNSLMNKDKYKKLVLAENNDLLESLSKDQLTIHKLNDKEIELFKKKSLPLTNEFIKNFSLNEKKLYDLIFLKKNLFRNIITYN